MKFVNLAIGAILFLEAITLLYSSTEKYNFHTFVGLVKSHWQECECMQAICFQCIQKMRLFVVAFILTGSLSLTFCDNVLIGFLAQLVWTITQNESYYSTGLNETKNTLTQILFTAFLFGSVLRQMKVSDIKQAKPLKIDEIEDSSVSKAAKDLKKQQVFTSEKKAQPEKKQQKNQAKTQVKPQQNPKPKKGKNK